MVVEDLVVELGKFLDSLFGHPDHLRALLLLCLCVLLSLLPAFLDDHEDLGQNEVHVAEEFAGVSLVDFRKQLDNRDRLVLDDFVDHLEDRVSEGHHGIGYILDNHVEAAEQ